MKTIKNLKKTNKKLVKFVNVLKLSFKINNDDEQCTRAPGTADRLRLGKPIVIRAAFADTPPFGGDVKGAEIYSVRN